MSLRRRAALLLGRLRRKIVKEPLPPENIAGGWALGIFIGCAIPFGMQLVIAIPLAMMLRVSRLGATIATFITNPATIFVIYPAQTFIVNKLLFGGSLTYSKLMETEWTWQAIRRLGVEVVASFFLGGFLLAIILTPITYFAVRRLVIVHRARTEQKKAKAGPDDLA